MAHYHITQIEDYEPLVGTETVQLIRQKAAKLKGLRVANFSNVERHASDRRECGWHSVPD
jgi:hypothetical protein